MPRRARSVRSSILLPLIASLILSTGLLPAGAVGGGGEPGDPKHAEADAPGTSVQLEADAVSMPTEPIGHTPCVKGKAGPFACHRIDLMTFLPPSAFGGGPSSQYGGPGNDVWGWTDPVTGKEWVLMGRANGTSFIDISQPREPVLVADMPRHQTNALWSDVKVYQDHAFVGKEGAGNGMQIFDLTRLRDIDYADAPVTVSPDAHYAGFGNAHNLAINEDSGFAYPVGTNTCGGSLHMVDVRDPLNPTFAGCYQDIPVSNLGYTHDAQCVNYHGPDERYQGREICFLSNPNTANQSPPPREREGAGRRRDGQVQPGDPVHDSAG